MTTDETDRMVAATLAAAKASSGQQTHLAYVEEYEAILAILQERKKLADTKSNVRG